MILPKCGAKVRPFRISACLALLLAGSCGGGGGGSTPGTADFTGRLVLQTSFPRNARISGGTGGSETTGGSIGAPNRISDEEPNDHLYSAGDLGAGTEATLVTGGVGGGVDPRDLFRMGPLGGDPAASTFEVSIEASRGLTLELAEGDLLDPAASALDLRGGDACLVAFKPGAEVVFSLKSPSPVRYRLRVRPYRPGSGAPLAAARRPSARGLSAARAERAEWLGTAAPERFEGRFLLGLPERVSPQERRRIEDLVTSLGLRKLRGESTQLWTDPILESLSDPLRRRALMAARLREIRRKVPGLRYASPEFRSPLSSLAGGVLPSTFLPFLQGGGSPNDQLYTSLQWNMRLAAFPAAWSRTVGKSSQVLAFLDTGFQIGHPDLAPRFLKSSYDFISDPLNSGDGDGVDPDPSEPTPFGKATLFHGTYVSGIAGAVTNNKIGVAGATWNPKLLGLRVFGVRGSTSYDRIQALRYLQGLPNDSKRILPLSERPRLLNMSYLLYSPTKAEYEEIQGLARRNVLMVAAMGNEAKNLTTPVYPAAWPEVIAVGAVGPDGRKTAYSNTGPFIEIAAPGGTTIAGPGGVVSTWAYSDPRNGKLVYGYNSFLGTSVATPHVLSTLALMDAVYPDITMAEARSVLRATVHDSGPSGWDSSYGYGLLDAGRAVAEAARRWRSPSAAVSPLTIDFGTDKSRGTVRIRNSGGGALARFRLLPVGKPSGRLSFDFDRFFAPAVLTVALDRKGLLPGLFKDRYELRTNAGSVFLDYVFESPIPTPKGPLVVRLLDGTRVLAETKADGAGNFRFSGVPLGLHRLVAGVDQNGNGKLGDPQEWFLDMPVRIGISGAPSLNGVVVPWRN